MTEKNPDQVKVVADAAPMTLSGDILAKIGQLLHANSEGRATPEQGKEVLEESLVVIQNLRNELKATNVNLVAADVRIVGLSKLEPQVIELSRVLKIYTRALEAIGAVVLMVRPQ